MVLSSRILCIVGSIGILFSLSLSMVARDTPHPGRGVPEQLDGNGNVAYSLLDIYTLGDTI